MRWRWAGALSLILTACGDDAAPASDAAPDAAVTPPGPCTLTASPTPLCTSATDSIPDAGSAQGGDAGDGGDGIVAAPESENRCLFTYDRTLDCPSLVGGFAIGVGAAGGTELVVSQRGISPGDRRAYPDRVTIDANGGLVGVASGVAPPYGFAGYGPDESVVIAGATSSRPASLLVLNADPMNPNPTSSELHIGDTSLTIPIAPSLAQNVLTSANGETFIAGPSSLVRGIPDAPRVITNTTFVRASAGFAIDTKGEPAGLFLDGMNLRLLEGEAFDHERWSMPTTFGSGSDILELAYVPTAPVFITRAGNRDEPLVRWLHEGETTDRFATIGQSFSTCPRANYLGVTCDACPVGQQCLAGEDNVVVARIFTKGTRVFATYVAHDTRRTLQYARHTLPIINAGCSCVLEEVSRQLSGDSLIVIEILDAGAGAAPTLVERMRVPLAGAGAVGTIRLSSRYDGDVDVVLGPEPVIIPLEGTTPPGPHPPYRVLRISTASIP